MMVGKGDKKLIFGMISSVLNPPWKKKFQTSLKYAMNKQRLWLKWHRGVGDLLSEDG